ncbi:hypothetical protein [Paenibacillus sp. Marseille-Q4541]|uniref:homing endonuclease associated repeat-containing protein n=1 Tax=Paenibacillus sp. Marseille-Q4541 TaxID=2831522 RepID=UPI001BAB2CD6|nr:hypothetical protein [Paenibacillus sp. Marseille-Q4541]
MKIPTELIENIRKVSKQSGGYLTTTLYDANRYEDMVSWDRLKKNYKLESFNDLLEQAKVPNKVQYEKEKNKIKAISNIKLLALEHGFVNYTLYEKAKLTPSAKYINTHYGSFDQLARESNVKLSTHLLTDDESIAALKETLKELGYIPTKKEYHSLNLTPTVGALEHRNLSWGDALRKAGYRPYTKSSLVRDKICIENSCYNQFSPSDEEETYCEFCYKKLRAELVKKLDKMNIYELKEITQNLIYVGNSQRSLRHIVDKLNY